MLVEVILVYRPGGAEHDGEFRVVRSHDPRAVRVVGLLALTEAREAVKSWQGVDANVALIRQAELDRLERVLALLIPEDVERARAGTLKLAPPMEPDNPPDPGAA